VSKRFGGLLAVDNLDLDVPEVLRELQDYRMLALKKA